MSTSGTSGRVLEVSALVAMDKGHKTDSQLTFWCSLAFVAHLTSPEVSSSSRMWLVLSAGPKLAPQANI